MKTTQDKIDNIMDNFNFNRVEKAMRATKWTWASASEEDSIPTETELREQARRLLKEASTKTVTKSDFRWYISTGGFRATKYFDGELELEFILSSWDTGE